MDTGLFFGSFNPIHIGHIALANYMREFIPLKEVWFVVSPQNPLKGKDSLLSAHHRMAMVRIAIESQKGFKASNIEFGLPTPSFTIHTLAHLWEKYPKKQFGLILGADNLRSFHKWKNYEQILAQSKLLVYPRKGYGGGDLEHHQNVIITQAPEIEVSSQFIRQGIADGKNMNGFLSESVATYLQEMKFYTKNRKIAG